MQESTDGTSYRSVHAVGTIFVWLAVLFVTLGGMYLGHVLAQPMGPVAMRRLSGPAPPQLPPPARPFTFPEGGRKLTDSYRLVALYGTPGDPVLGALGQQPLEESIARAKAIAAVYAPHSTVPVLPTFEIIASIASASPTENGDYSREVDPAAILPWIKAAQTAGMYVVLDLQPGRTDFLTQAKEYTQLLQHPNVGLALDPEWRLAPEQVPLKQIGSVSIGEVNSVARWLAILTTQNHLPQKLFVLHQFRLDMLPAREQLVTSYPELAYTIQMDGQGTQPQKQDTWKSIVASPPPHVAFGWKNFYHQDAPMLDEVGTMQIAPQPWYVSYQ
ncbi:MAG TPA: hypothetical protein VLH38_01955 [Patescibacteria group bacterium]|nr:hypothetical protein [Patescibacteria group bacterium]